MNPQESYSPQSHNPGDQPDTQSNYQAGQMSPQQQQDYDKPVAYDQQGRPLYARPPQGAMPLGNTNTVYWARPLNPQSQPVPPEIQQRHEASRKQYPDLNLSAGEYIIAAVKRHPIGLLQIWFIVIFLILFFGAAFVMLFLGQSPTEILSQGLSDEQSGAGLLLLALSVLFVLGGMVASYIYNNNRFYLTNESVIQEIQTTLFSKHEQTVSLSNIEDASYKQNGILPMLFNFGTIRLSTEGDETTYSFSYVANPKKHIAVLNNAVEAFKNGRPVEDLPNQDQPS